MRAAGVCTGALLKSEAVPPAWPEGHRRAVPEAGFPWVAGRHSVSFIHLKRKGTGLATVLSRHLLRGAWPTCCHVHLGGNQQIKDLFLSLCLLNESSEKHLFLLESQMHRL